MLPTILQSMIPKLPSLRRSVSGYRGRLSHVETESFGSVTPPPSYSSRSGSCTPVLSRLSLPDVEDPESEGEPSIYERPTLADSQVPHFPSTEAKSGVNWKYANQGLSLITHSYQEAASLSRQSEHGLPSFSRQLYMHGVTYILRGLPADMTTEEILSVQTAMPSDITNLQNCKDNTLVSLHNNRTMTPKQGPSEEPSVLHRITATLVVQLFVLAQFLLPYIKLFIGHAYRYERKYKVTERVFNKSVYTVDEFSRRTLQLTNMVCSMDDGKAGQAINDMIIWWIRGVIGGIHQGLSEGVLVIGADARWKGKERSDRASS